MSERGNFFADRRRIASNISFFAFVVNVIQRISSGFAPFSSQSITFSDSVVVFPVPGFETTIVSPFDSRIAFCSGDGLNLGGLDLAIHIRSFCSR